MYIQVKYADQMLISLLPVFKILHNSFMAKITSAKLLIYPPQKVNVTRPSTGLVSNDRCVECTPPPSPHPPITQPTQEYCNIKILMFGLVHTAVSGCADSGVV